MCILLIIWQFLGLPKSKIFKIVLIDLTNTTLDYIVSQLPDYASKIAKAWLGGTDENVEGQWEWVTGEPWVFTKWLTGQPDGGTAQNYLWSGGLDYDGSAWDDLQNVTVPNSYILEKDDIAVPVNSYLSLLDLPWSDLQSSIQQVANARAQNGAEQMRLQMEGDLNATNSTNLEQALSRIQDVDIAQATSDLSRTTVLIEAGTAMLAQANQSSKSILSLIMQN